MRRVILITVTLLVLLGLFLGLLWNQRAVLQTAGQQPQPATRPTDDDAQAGSFGSTRLAWLTMYDTEVTGLPKVRFRGDELIPQTGDQVLVQRPQVEFFIGAKRDEVVRVVGKTGLVIMPGEGPRVRSNLTLTRTSPPTRGQMTDVVVSYFRSQQAAEADRADIVMTLPNAYFDNDRYEIATEGYTDASGRQVAATEVPVKIRGEAFDFDGRGLVIRWDEASQRLRSLVVYHGEQLVLKRPIDQVRDVRGGQAARAIPGIQLAAADAKQALQAAASLAERVYRATFHDGVIVTQENVQLATATAMHVDFLDRSSPDTAAMAGPGGDGAKPAAKAPVPAPKESAARDDSMGLDPDKPVVIRWAGQLTVGAAPEEPLRPGSADDAVVRLAGSETEPARIFSEDRTIEAQWVAYRVEEQFAWVEGAQDRPVRMTDADGSVLITPQLRYSDRSGVAELRGPSSAEVVSVQDGEKQVLKARWREIAEARFARDGKSRGISSLVLRGGVQVDHPQIREFSSGELLLEFDQPAKSDKANPSGELKRLVARKDVNCVLVDEENEAQSIKAQELDLALAKGDDGKAHPSRIVAVGSVVAGNATQKIAADRVEADLDRPEKSAAKSTSAVEFAGLRNLLAIGNVQLDSEQGEVVKGDRLQMRQTGERKNWVLLEGKPATVAQQGTVLAGQFIEIDTATERAIITGGGELQLSDTKVLGEGAKPVQVKWTGDGRLDGPEDKVVVAGNVQVHNVDSEGAINDAVSDRVEILLGRKAAQADEKPKKGRQFNFMSNRFARQITMLPSEGREVRLQSLLPGENNTILRQINLFGPRVDVMLEPTEAGGSRVQRVVVPAGVRPGRMLYVELPPATREAVKTGDPLQARSLPGSTAFAWSDRLEYDASSSQVTMTGGVMIRHEPPLPAGKSFQIDGETIIVDVAPKSDAKSSGPASAMEVKKITLTGSPVHLVRDDIDFVAPKVEVDPAGSTIIATGTDLAMVNVERGRVTGSMRRVEINTKTNMINFEGAQGTGRQ